MAEPKKSPTVSTTLVPFNTDMACFFVSESAARYSSTKRFSVAVNFIEVFEEEEELEEEEFVRLGEDRGESAQ